MMADAIDPALHAPARLQIAAVLAQVSEAEFAKLREIADVSDSVLSKHLSALVGEGYLTLRKSPFEGRQRTWAALTKTGKQAFASHMRALHTLADVATTAAEADAA